MTIREQDTMAKADTPAARSPRGTKPVAQAFFTALDNIPDASRAAVAKAAQAMIRDEMKQRREKLKMAAAKEKARKTQAAPGPKAAAAASPRPAVAKPVRKPNGKAPVEAAIKKRTRKSAALPTEA